MGNQSMASENAIIIDDKIHKLGHVDIAYPKSVSIYKKINNKLMTSRRYDQNSLMNPWILTTPKMRLVLAPFVEYQTESSKWVFLAANTRQVFGKIMGTVQLDSGEELEFTELTAFGEINVATW